MSPIYTPSDNEINDPPPPLSPEKAKKLSYSRWLKRISRILAVLLIVGSAVALALAVWRFP